MRRLSRLTILAIFLSLSELSPTPALTPGDPAQNKPAAETPSTTGVIKTETNLVLVDVAVTGKKQEYLKDLGQNDFHIFEDGAEQNIVSFTREAEIKPDAPGHDRYMVLFFDDTSLPRSADQMVARQAAAKFVEAYASPHRLMAVMDYGGALIVAQNFTAKGDLLNQAVINPKPSAVHTNGGGGRGDKDARDAAIRALLLAIRNVAEGLRPIPGRKVIILFSGGFPTDTDTEFDFDNTLDALNKANVGVYSLGAQGLEARQPSPPISSPGPISSASANSQTRRQQAPRPTGMGGGPEAYYQVLHVFSAHTGGFPILNTNDLVGGMEQVAQEMEQSYVLGYVPPTPTHEGDYHHIRVKVDVKGTEVRARDGYFDVKAPDLLAAKPEGKALEAHAAATDAGEIPIEIATPYFYVQPGVALVDLSLSIPGSALEFEKEKGQFHSHLDVLGIAYRDDGSVAARFSDTVKVDVGKEGEEQAAKSPFAYQKCFRIAPGKYILKVLLTGGGQKFGKSELPLNVSPFTGNELTLSGPAFGDKILALAPQLADVDTGLLENTKPLIANGVQIQPSANTHFSTMHPATVYLEIYEPLLKTGPVRVMVVFKLVDLKTMQTVFYSGPVGLDQNVRAGVPLVPVAFKLPFENVPPGNYRIDFWSLDSAGKGSPVRSREISVE